MIGMILISGESEKCAFKKSRLPFLSVTLSRPDCKNAMKRKIAINI